MSDELRPPPYPVASDDPTEPGIGSVSLAAHITLRKENMRLRQERNAARDELDKQLRSSMPPTPVQRKVALSLNLGKYTALLTLVPVVGAVLAKVWPAYKDLIETVTSWVPQQ
jgi:hypothetical protein